MSSVRGVEAVRRLAEVAEKAGVEVRIEAFTGRQLAGKGGLCRVRGKLVILVDEALRPLDQAGVIGRALAEIDLGDEPLPEDLASFVRTGHAKVKPLVRPRPLHRARETKKRP